MIKTSPFNVDAVVNEKKGIRQGNTAYPKGFGAILDDLQLHHLRSAEDTVLMTASSGQEERVVVDLDCACGGVRLQPNFTKVVFTRNGSFALSHRSEQLRMPYLLEPM